MSPNDFPDNVIPLRPRPSGRAAKPAGNNAPAALAGARLCRATARRNGQDADALPLAASGLAWRLSGEALCTPCTRHADWLLVPARSDGGRIAGVATDEGSLIV